MGSSLTQLAVSEGYLGEQDVKMEEAGHSHIGDGQVSKVWKRAVVSTL